MKDELIKQCEMAWNRGYQLGLIEGIMGTFIIMFVVWILTLWMLH